MASVIALAGLTFAILHSTTSDGYHLAASGASPAALGAGPTSSASSAGLGTVTPAGTVQATSTATAEPRSAAALGLAAGALALPDSMTTQAASWSAGHGGTALAAISAQVGSVVQAESLHQYAEMKATCLALAADVKTAQADPPIPDATMQTLYAKALASLATGAADCANAITDSAAGDEQVLTHEDSAQLNQSVAELQAGTKDLFQATAEITALRDH